MFKNQQKVETPNVSPSLVSEEIHEPNSVSSPPPSSPPTINKSTGNVEIPHSLLTEIIFTDEELSNYLAPHPPTIEPSTTSYFANPEIKVSIILMPHKHTLFCERKVENRMFWVISNRKEFAVLLEKFKNKKY